MKAENGNIIYKVNESSRRTLNLSEIVSPQTIAEFFSENWCSQYKYIKGQADRFKDLISWEDINKVLRRHRLEPPRLRLALEGKILPVSEYIDYHRGNRSNPIPRIKPVELTDLLHKGATLVLDSVNELHDPLSELSRSLERVFEAHVQINLYAGYRATHGFDLHWDDHEVFILQIIGRKSWAVYEPTRRYPMKRDVVETPPPQGDPAWDGILEAGDVLYIPRGWHHMAVPLDEPTLHITIGVSNPTGYDLLRWMADRLIEKNIVREDLPRFGSVEDKESYIGALRHLLLKFCDEELLDRYFERYDASVSPPPQLSLPWSLSKEGLPDDESALIRTASPRPWKIIVSSENNSVEILAIGKRWRFAQSTKIILRILNDGQYHSIAELCDASSKVLDKNDARILIGELVVNGLVTVSL